MADDMNVVGDLSGGNARKKQLEEIRKSAEEASQEINALSKEFKKLSSVASANKNIGLDVGKVKALNKSMTEMTVSALKSSKERKKFSTQILAAEKEQAATTEKIKSLSDQIKARKEEEAAQDKIANELRKQSRDEQLAFTTQIANAKAQQAQLESDSFTMLEQAKRSGNEAMIAEAEAAHQKQMSAATKQGDIAKTLTATSEEQLAVIQKKINAQEDLVKLEQEEISALTGQKTLAEEINAAQEKQLKSAKDLEQEMIKVNAAGNGTLKAFANLGQTVGSMLPVLGGAFNTVFGELGKAQTMFEDAVAQGTSKSAARFKALTGTIQALSMAGLAAFASLALEGAKNASEAFKIVKKGLGGGLIDASAAMRSASGAASAMGIPLQEAAGYIGQMNDALGTSLGFSAKQVTTFGTLTRNMGVSGEAAAKLFKFAVKTGTSYEDMAAKVGGTTEKLNAMNGTAVAPKAVFEEMGNASQTILRNMKSNPDALIKAAAGARAMGMEMNKIADAAESTLDFESSMAKEMEAELMLGKDLNLDKLRAAAATGDQVTMQEEMKRLVMENKDALDGNVLAQGKMADTLGISKEELNKMLNTTEDQAKMAEQDASRKKANAENEKKTNRELGQEQLKTFRSINSLADRIAKFQESLALGAKSFFDAFLEGIKPLTDLFKKAFATGDWGEGIKTFFMGLPKALGSTLGNLGTLVKDSIMGGFSGIGDALSKEGDSILSKGGILGKMLGGLVAGGLGVTLAVKGGKSLIKAGKNLLGLFTGKKKGMDNVDVLNGAAKVTMAGGGPMDLLGNKGRAGLFKQFRTLFKKPKLFFRALKMKGGMLGKIVGNIGTRISNIKLPSLTKMFSKIKLPNLTNMFSKIKLPKLPNFKLPKLPKFPKLPSLKIPKIPNVGKGLTSMLSKVKIPPGAATGLLKGIGGKILAPLELVMGAVKGVGQVAGKSAEEKKAAGIKESMGTTEAGILGALTGGAEKGSMFSEKLGIEKGGAGDEALGIATAGARGAMTGAAIGSVIPVVGTAVGAAVGGAIGLISEGFKVFSDPNSTLRKGVTEFATATWDKAKEIGNKVKEGAKMVGAKIKDFAVGVKDQAVAVAGRMKDFAVGVKDKAVAVAVGISNFAVGVKDKAVAFASSVGEGISNFATAATEKAAAFATSVGEGITNFASSAADKISSFGASVGAGIMSFADTARDKAKAFAGAVGEKIGNIRGKIGEFLEANDGLVGGIRAAASGLASKASEWFGSKVQGLKDWWNGDSKDKSKDAAPQIKEAEIKKVTTPLVNMSAQQSKELVGALNTALTKGAENTVKAVNTFGENIQPFITESKVTAENQLKELKDMQKESDIQHRKEMAAAKVQIALLVKMADTKITEIKMDSYNVAKALNSNY